MVERPGGLSIRRQEDTRRGAGLLSSLDQAREGKDGVTRSGINSESDKEVGLKGLFSGAGIFLKGALFHSGSRIVSDTVDIQ